MKVIKYDGSIEGFFTVVFNCYYQKFIPDKITRKSHHSSLVDEVLFMETDLYKSQKVLTALQEKFPTKHFRRIMHTFLCDENEFELDLLHFIILGFKDTSHLNNINHHSVFRLENLEKELFRVVHKMYGFIRFEELEDNTLYAKIEPKFNILPLIGKHFYQRLSPYNLIIHDIKREQAYVKQDKSAKIHVVAEFDTPSHSYNEEKFQQLWKLFFETISIKERKNKKLQQNWVPLHYRKHMLEFITSV